MMEVNEKRIQTKIIILLDSIKNYSKTGNTLYFTYIFFLTSYMFQYAHHLAYY